MKKIIVSSVCKNSLADQLGIEAGDAILSINEMSFTDILEYKFLCNDDFLLVEFEKPNGEVYCDEIESNFADLGLNFENPLIDEARSCQNKCVFCFIDQLPNGLRKSLYFKDDDTRLSLLHGNFVTLTNMSEDDINNIIYMRLSPIYISVHTTNPCLRKKMLNNKNADKLYERMQKLSDHGIIMRTQIVACPDLNDKEELVRTIEDLAKLKNVENISVVPVGLSKFREGLYGLRNFTMQEARDVIEIIKSEQEKFVVSRGDKVCHASDEFYIKAELPCPSISSYGIDGVNLEDGVGLVSMMRETVTSISDNLPLIKKNREISMVTGVDSFPLIRELVDLIEERCSGLKVHLYKIVNEFFGEEITVTGLLTATDIIKQLKGKTLGKELLIASCMLKHGENLFLDDRSTCDLENELHTTVKVIYDGHMGKTFVEGVLDEYEIIDTAITESEV